MIRTQVYLPQNLYTQIQLRAAQANQPAAVLIRKYLTDGYKKNFKKGSAKEALLELARHAGKGGPPDLATNHDDYLYGDKR